MEYNIYIIAYPSDSGVEKYLEEKIMNIPKPPRNHPVYCSLIEGFEANNVAEELNRCLNNGFGVKEEKQND